MAACKGSKCRSVRKKKYIWWTPTYDYVMCSESFGVRVLDPLRNIILTSLFYCYRHDCVCALHELLYQWCSYYYILLVNIDAIPVIGVLECAFGY